MAAVVAAMASETAPGQAAALRAELKEWERAFAAANGGKKAGRDDIKQNPEIGMARPDDSAYLDLAGEELTSGGIYQAAKYKLYNRLKSLESKPTGDSPSFTGSEHTKKRKHASPNGPGDTLGTTTPRKAAKSSGGAFVTPSIDRQKNHIPSQLDLYDSPSTLRRLFSPSTHMHAEPSPQPLKHAIGPTPQRDGKILGLFDLLSESGGSKATPSAKRMTDIHGAAYQTPSKRKSMAPILEVDEGNEAGQDHDDENTPRGRRTPASSGKKHMLANLFATPTTLRYAALVETDDDARALSRFMGDGGGGAGDISTENGAIAPTGNPEPSETDTPVFLRRSNSGRYGVNGAASAAFSPTVVRKPPSFVGKGLTALVQGLREMEEERMQDDWDVLNEIEAENLPQTAADDEVVQVNDSQAALLNGEGGRIWKKKGQKRTTRRVKMKPVVLQKTKPAPQHAQTRAPDEENDSDDELAAVPATQANSSMRQGTANDSEDRNGDSDDDASLHTMTDPESGPSDSDGEYTGEPVAKTIPKSKSFAEKIKQAISAAVKPKSKTKSKAKHPGTDVGADTVGNGKLLGTKVKDKDDRDKKPRERKVNPEAHANYRSLKIRNKNSKARGGRFGRRR